MNTPRSELQDALDVRFPTARIISQHVMLASVINWSDAPSIRRTQTRRISRPGTEDEIYLLGMAGSELPPEPGRWSTLGRFAGVRRWLEHIDLQRRHIDDQARYLRTGGSGPESRRAALERLRRLSRSWPELRAQQAEFLEATRGIG